MSRSPEATATRSCLEQPKGPLSELSAGAETHRQAVIEADALVVDQKWREAEARLHHAGRSFFTRRFREAVDEVTTVFADGSERIGDTAADLAERNTHMHVKVASASDAARVVSEDVAEIAVSARGILSRIKRSAGDIGAPRQANDRAAAKIYVLNAKKEIVGARHKAGHDKR